MDPHTFTDVDAAHLMTALDLAARGACTARPNPTVGAVIASGRDVVATGWHARQGDRHAERIALDAAGELPGDATLYVTLEPCAHEGRQPPCTDAILASGVRRVVIGCADPAPHTSGIGPARLEDAGVTVVWAPRGIRDLIATPIAGFLSVHTRARPWLRLKWAMARNGRLATGDPANPWISCAESRAYVHELRARSGGVLVGVGTVLADDPMLTVRGEAAKQQVAPVIRIVLDRSLRTPLTSRLVVSAAKAPVLIMCSADADVERVAALTGAGVQIWQAPASTGGDVFLLEAMKELARRGTNDVLAEPGPTLGHALYAGGLVDAFLCHVSPRDAPGDQPGLAVADPLRLLVQEAIADGRFRFRGVDLEVEGTLQSLPESGSCGA